MTWKRHKNQLKANNNFNTKEAVSFIPRSSLDTVNILDYKESENSGSAVEIGDTPGISQRELRRRSQIKGPDRLIIK